jgi:hypothetical protein
MTDRGDGRLRALVRELVEASLPPPPLPTARRRRGRRRAAALVCAVALVVAGAVALGYFAASRGGGHRTTVRARPGGPSDSYAVIDSGSAQSTLVDLATGASRTVAFDGKAGGDWPYSLFVTGGYFVYPGQDGVMAVPVGLDRPPSSLGRTSVPIPSSTPGRVWLITTTVNGQPVAPTAQEVSVDGSYHSPQYQLPGGVGGAIASVNGGIVRVGGASTDIWYPDTNTTGPKLSNIGSAFVGAQGSRLAWGLDCSSFSACRAVKLLDVATNRSRTYPAPKGTAGWVPTGGQGSHNVLSPDGKRLALRAALTRGVPNTVPASRVYALDLATGTTTLVPHSEAPAYSRIAWSPDGQWVLFETNAHTLGAYRPAKGTFRTLPQQCCEVVGLLTVAVPPSSTAAPKGWTTYPDPTHGLSISYPRSWHPAPSTLTPVLVDPLVPVALGTYPLQPHGPGECDIVPSRALEALGPTDAFIAVYVYDRMATWQANTDRPLHFGPNNPWQHGQI